MDRLCLGGAVSKSCKEPYDHRRCRSGLAPPRDFPLPFEVNKKLWQFSFNILPELPELLTRGRERELFDWLFNNKAVHPERITRANGTATWNVIRSPGG